MASERATPAFVRHVRDAWGAAEQLPGLLEASENVERLLSHPGYAAVRAVLDREIATIDRELDEGPAKEAPVYAQRHGRRGALRSFDEAAKAIVESAAAARAKAEDRARASDAAAEAAERI